MENKNYKKFSIFDVKCRTGSADGFESERQFEYRTGHRMETAGKTERRHNALHHHWQLAAGQSRLH